MGHDPRNDTPPGAAVRIGADGIPEVAGLPASRRSFLKLVGFSFAAAMLPGCSRGEEHEALPFLTKPEEVTPGVSRHYASLCMGCEAGCGILATSRDGRPIKIEGNPEHPISRGTTCAIGQASLLSLYDSKRLTEPLSGGKPTTWGAADARVRKALAAAQTDGKAVRVLTGTVNGPTALHAIERFLAPYADAKHVGYDALSSSALLDAHADLYGARVLPRYRLENARALVSIDADFLGTWLSPLELTRGWTEARRLDPERLAFCHHVQFESRLSLTGTNADRRHAVAPDALPLVAGALAQRVMAAKGVSVPWTPIEIEGLPAAALDAAAKRLLDAPEGRALVACGLNDPFAQRATAYMNHLLGADAGAESTCDLTQPSHQRRGDDRALAQLTREMRAGKVGVLLVWGCNPLYDLPDALAFGDALGKVGTVIGFSERLDETAAAAGIVCPDHHPFESWRDAEPIAGLVTVGQPLIRPLRGTRAFVESLAAWSGEPESDREILQSAWKARVFSRQGAETSFERFLAAAVHDGLVQVDAEALELDTPDPARIGAPPSRAARPDGVLQLVLYPKIALLDGRHAHNPWLQELPDPVSKVSWDNYASLAPATAERLGVVEGDVVRLKRGADDGDALSLPVVVQVGQVEDTVAVALGYGAAGTDRFHDVGPEWIEGRSTVEPGGTVGVNVAPWIGIGDGRFAFAGMPVELERTEEQSALARTQIYHSLDVPAALAPSGQRRRHVAQHTTLAAWRDDPSAGAHSHPEGEELWAPDHAYKGHHWGLAIDLSACTGCAACVVACQAENNVPAVGKDEIRRQREMHWIRIDRYFQESAEGVETVHQPMMCQQCDHAPCETVCPVLATVHSSEGLNQQVYNRCVGTRYCSNNCPYKVRRFNWFDYPHDDRLQNMALNPDVTVRTRGVMEKCTFCVQRIQAAKADAKREGRDRLHDGDVQTACMQACPAGAVVFGDMNDPESGVRAHMGDPRAFRVLDELNVRPSVTYLRQVKDRPPEPREKHHG